MLRIFPVPRRRKYLHLCEDEEKVEEDEGTTRPSCRRSNGLAGS